LIGSLLYLSVCTRPDIAYAASCLRQYNTEHTKEHWLAAKRVLRYLKGTMDVGPTFKKLNEDLDGYVDADWAGEELNRKSYYTGYIFAVGALAISWGSREQAVAALSSTEAEYIALAEASKEAMIEMVKEIGFDSDQSVYMFCDNQVL